MANDARGRSSRISGKYFMRDLLQKNHRLHFIFGNERIAQNYFTGQISEWLKKLPG